MHNLLFDVSVAAPSPKPPESLAGKLRDLLLLLLMQSCDTAGAGPEGKSVSSSAYRGTKRNWEVQTFVLGAMGKKKRPEP